jgi:hypothetical protein
VWRSGVEWYGVVSAVPFFLFVGFSLTFVILCGTVPVGGSRLFL